MKSRYYLTIKGLLLLGLISFTAPPAFAQLEDVGSIIQSGTADANTLIRAYLKPFGSGFGAGLNTGWTNTAKPHRKLGFDITVSAGLVAVPDAEKTFDVTQLGLQRLQYESGPTISQTINGAGEQGSTLAAYTTIDPDGPGGIAPQQYQLAEFTMPQGSGFGFVPAPMIKAGIGTIKNTDIMIRYTPEIDIGDFGTFKLFGIGAKHGINQWLPGGKLIPVDISVMFGYTGLEVSSGFEVTPADVMQAPANTENPYGASQWEGQGIELTTDAWTVNALVGKTLPVVSVYGGVGFEASTFNIRTPGSYPTVIPNESATGQDDLLIVNAVDEPLDVEIKGDNGFHVLAGFRVRFTVLHISASYTLAKYSTANVGFGISFR